MERSIDSRRDCMMGKQNTKFLDFILGDDMDFYEEFVVNLSDEDQLKFLEKKILNSCRVMVLTRIIF